MKLTTNKIILTNLVIIFLALVAKLWNYFYLAKMSEIFSRDGGGKVSTDFVNLYLYQHEDVVIVITDISVYIIIVGLLINLFFYFSMKKSR